MKHKKLRIRFWKAIKMYDRGETYESVLQTLFGAKSSATTKYHKKNKNFNSNL